MLVRSINPVERWSTTLDTLSWTGNYSYLRKLVSRIIVPLAVCCLGLVLPTCKALAERSKRPNVIVIMTDDQGYGDLSCHGNPTLKTPNLDALSSESIRFTDFHVAPFCTPTRAALMTGRYPARTGAYRTSSGRTSLHKREKTLGDLFTINGYATGMFGKWHLGDNAPTRPMDKGFERSVWHRCGGVTQISDYWGNDYFDDTYLVGDKWKKFDGYCTDVWFDEAMGFIDGVLTDAGGNKPFFVYLATNAPHGPYLVGPEWKKPYLDAGCPPQQAAFKGMVANFDWNLGRLRRFLKTEQLDSETILVFLTDNGTSAGALFGEGRRITGFPLDPSENGYRRGGKSSAYEGGHRVPLFIRHYDTRFNKAKDVDALAMHFDITPTLMDLCDLQRPADWPKLDGKSLVSLMGPRKATWPDRILHTQMHGGNGFLEPDNPWLIGAVMTPRWRLVEGRELYDIQQDPMQRTDVASKFPKVVANLRKEHLTWYQTVKSGMVPSRIVIGSDLENPTDLTSQEWVMSSGGPPWAKTHVVKRKIANSHWAIDVAVAGRYRFTISRWPNYIERPIDSKAARVRIAGQEKAGIIPEPDQQVSVSYEFDLPAGPTELKTWLTTPEGKTHGAYFVTVERLRNSTATVPSLLWTQYGLSNDTLKIAVHTDADPLNAVEAETELWLKQNGKWQRTMAAVIDPLTAMAVFRIDNWRQKSNVSYQVRSGKSVLQGVIRANPKNKPVLKLMVVACVNDKWFPYEAAVKQMIDQDPDLVFFAGDQIYESNAGGEVVLCEQESEVPEAMANYLAKWRKFGLTFRDLLKDRPSIMITDDHDVYASDLWGDGGRRMTGPRTSGGYPMHPIWVNAVEATQTWHLPDAVAKGPWGDGINAYFTALDYGGVSFAILEDRKFKSPPSLVVKEAVKDPLTQRPNRTPEVIMDPAFDVSALDKPELQLLGKAQETFVRDWAAQVAKSKTLAAVLSQSPFVNIGNYDVRYGDMDANGWPQTARNRALKAIAPSKAVMLSGDIHFGTLHQHGINDWGDGPWGYSVPAFASKQNRKWGPSVPAQGREIPGIPGTGNHHDRFGNKLTVAATAPGANGYGMVKFDKSKMTIVCELHSMDAERQPDGKVIPGWPLQIDVTHK
ncbi:MAG TPA: hypothetical protein DEF45_02235 [Rhodopirellula sp.]|nr:hypothetical protein [Rhodopirellula sp.]